MRSIASILAGLSIAAGGAAAQVEPLIPDVLPEGARMGLDVAANSKWAAVSTVGLNRFFLFRRTASEWVFETAITSATGLSGFRGDVEVSGDCVLAAAPWDNPSGGHSGSVYAYCYSDAGWQLDGVIRPEDPRRDANFGLRIAFAGDVALSQSLGGYWLPADSMAVYVHRRGSGGWQQEAKLQLQGLPDDAFFGTELTISSGLIGAGLIEVVPPVSLRESYLIFARGDDGWAASDTLRFGIAGGAVLTDTRLFLGDPEAQGAEGYRRGAVRVFERVGDRFVLEDSIWSDRELSPYPWDPECPFGRVLDARADTLIAAHDCPYGAMPLDTVEVFTRGSGGWARVLTGTLGLSEADPAWPRSFALGGAHLVVGLPGSDEHSTWSGAAYAVPISSILTAREPQPGAAWANVAPPSPNPARTWTLLAIAPGPGPYRVEVIDALGRTVRAHRQERIDNDGLRVDVTGIAPGTYMVRVMGAGGTWNSRVTVAR
jgi:hypothetical protein